MKFWRLLPQLSAPMPIQMALDEVLFRSAEQDLDVDFKGPQLRFYFSSEPWITVGYSEEPSAVDVRGYRVCRRLTGGGRVFHGRDVIFSIVAGKSDDESFKSVRISYLKIHEALKAGFERLGFKPRFYRCDEPLPAGKECFVFPIATDLALEDKKVAGGSQKRSSGTLLHQESVIVPPGILPQDLIRAFTAGFEDVFGVRCMDVPLDLDVLKKARSLAVEKYFVERRKKRRTLATVGAC